ncbi:Fluoroquinolones export ATP-binding protein [Bacillus sp. THAF10]|nr:ABC transporter ATP-binding protein [Bacillus sp. THAF10]QFT91118.1 Fluoroquinolones export ATP-binding protein [Bacillus sp. THAF10]
MLQPIIQIKHLTKSFLTQTVVEDLSLNIPQGSLYGFLGPNGAGKTTTMRMLIGLISPDEGEVIIKDKNINSWKESLFSQVGCFIDSPNYYPNLSAFENLAYIQKVINKPLSEVDRVLKITGIYDARDKKVRNYSLGMKQRLGLAFALLNDPEILILDEPTNGLDPEGIHEIRHLLIELSKNRGKTVFVSSHNLAEIEMMADYISLINKGKLVYEGKLNKVLASGEYILKVDQLELTKTILENEEIPFNINNFGQFILNISEQLVARIVRLLVENNVNIYEITSRKQTLEEMFLTLTSKKESLHVT